jgi:hypothetical protein
MLIEFLQWLEDNQWHRYKDGTYYSTSPDQYVHGTQRKFYTKEELIENYEHTNSRRVC